MKSAFSNLNLAIALAFLVPISYSEGQEGSSSLLTSVRPQIDIAIGSDANLFTTNGGVVAGGEYDFRFFKPLSAGILLSYHPDLMKTLKIWARGKYTICFILSRDINFKASDGNNADYYSLDKCG